MSAGDVLRLEPLTIGNMLEAVDDLRDDDFRELAAGPTEPSFALEYAFHSTVMGAAIYTPGGKVAGVLGLSMISLGSARGYPWFLSCKSLEPHWREFARRSVDVMAEMQSMAVTLEGHCDARYKRALGWLRFLGFALDAPKPFGRNGEPFHRFHWERIGHV